jgi:hypothetical protein
MEDEELFFQETIPSYCPRQKSLNVRGIPVQSGCTAPLIVLVPDIQAQTGNFSMSFLNVSGTLQSLLHTAYVPTAKQKEELKFERLKERMIHFNKIRSEDNYLHYSSSPNSSPPKSPNKVND